MNNSRKRPTYLAFKSRCRRSFYFARAKAGGEAAREDSMGAVPTLCSFTIGDEQVIIAVLDCYLLLHLRTSAPL